MHGNIRYASKWIARSLNLEACRRILDGVGLSTSGRLKELQNKISRRFKSDSYELLGLMKKDELVALCNLTQLTHYDGEKHTVCPVGHPGTLRHRLDNIIDELIDSRVKRDSSRSVEDFLGDEFVDESEEDDSRVSAPDKDQVITMYELPSNPGGDVKRWLESKNLFCTDGTDELKFGVENWMLTARLEKRCKSVQPIDTDDFELTDFQSERFPDLVNYLSGLLEAKWGKTPAPFECNVSRPLERRVLAFYAPLHFWEDWGVYLHADEILHQARKYQEMLKGIPLFDFGLICHFVVFEVFHHEFYHHQVESFAIASEILLSSQGGEPKRLYQELGRKGYAREVEEAMANAYAYNSLGMANRISHDSKHEFISLYQRAVKEAWNGAQAGYNAAAKYIAGRHIQGSVEIIHSALGADLLGATLLARNVMPQGHSVMVHKSKIPLYLAGTDKAMEELLTNVPAIRETASQLWLPYDLTNLNKEVKRIKEEWNKKHKKANADDEPEDE